MKKRCSPLFIIFIVFCLILFFGFVSVVFSPDKFKGVSFKDKVGIIKIEGIIFDSEEILRQLDEFKKNKSVKAIVLRINSPGGAVAPSQEIYKEIKNISKEKKIIASMGTVAASGGYYIACATDEIFANPGTITGSIGVIMEFTNLQELMGKIGISTETIKSGEFKDTGSLMRKMTDKEREYIQAVILDVYEQFVEDVSKGRNLAKEKIYPIADGRILTGKKALQEKLIDKIGTIKDAVKRAAELAGIEGDPEVIYARKRRLGFLDMFFEETKGLLNRYIAQNSFNINYLMKVGNTTD